MLAQLKFGEEENSRESSVDCIYQIYVPINSISTLMFPDLHLSVICLEKMKSGSIRVLNKETHLFCNIAGRV